MKQIIFTISLLTIAIVVGAQETERIDTTDTRSLLKRLELLENKISAQESKDELERLLMDADNLSARQPTEEADLSKKFYSGIRQQQGLNPNISVLGDFFGSFSSADNRLINEPTDYSHGSNGFYMRSLELSMVAALDPYARGKAFLDISDEGISIEEAYMEIINLPLNMSVKAGVFFPEYGLLNRHHTHALPQFDRPHVAVNYFDLDGFNGIGTALNFMLPGLLFADASSLDLTVININDNKSFASNTSFNVAFVGHFKNYYDLSEASYFEYTISTVSGKNDLTSSKSHIGNIGLHYRWSPPSLAKYKSFDWKTEFYYGHNETPFGIVRSKGFYSSVHRKLDTRFWVGGRIGYSEMPYDNDQHEWDYTANIDFWQSEFVFYRIQYQYNSRDISYLPGYVGNFPSAHTILLQFSWAMGPHKHDAY